MKIIARDNQNGVALILVVLMIAVMLFMGMFFITNSLTEKLIASSQAAGVNTYYLAEAGINEMIWRIVNDPLYETNFMFNDNWATTTLRNDPFGTGSGQYEVTASNTSAAHCDITAVGRYDIGNGNFAQRILKINVFRAIGTSPVGDSAGYADGNVAIRNSYVNFLNGSAHSNGTFDVNNQNVEVFIDADVRAGGNYLQHSLASTTIEGWIYASNWESYPLKGTGTTAEIPMPAIDFNSSAPTSHKQRALTVGQYYTESQFDALLCEKVATNGTLNLVDKVVIYVAGSVDLSGGMTLRSPQNGGVLVVEGDFVVGAKSYKTCGGVKYYGNPNIDFDYKSKPSGIISSRKIMFLDHTGNVNIEGAVYANAELDLKNLSVLQPFYVKGGLISQKLDIDSCYGWPTIDHNNEILINTIGSSDASPTIIVEHWEEEY